MTFKPRNNPPLAPQLVKGRLPGHDTRHLQYVLAGFCNPAWREVIFNATGAEPVCSGVMGWTHCVCPCHKDETFVHAPRTAEDSLWVDGPGKFGRD